jgi:hypothetical protein
MKMAHQLWGFYGVELVTLNKLLHMRTRRNRMVARPYVGPIRAILELLLNLALKVLIEYARFAILVVGEKPNTKISANTGKTCRMLETIVVELVVVAVIAIARRTANRISAHAFRTSSS